MSKKQLLILAGLAVGGVGLASMMAEEGDDSGIPQQIKERAGKILGGSGKTTTTTTTGEVAGSKKDAQIARQPDVYFSAFPTDEDVFGQDPAIENQDKPAAHRGAGSSFAHAESIPMGADVAPLTKKEAVSRTMLPIAPAGIAAKGAIQAAAGVEARRVSSAGVAGGGAITSFLKSVGGYAVSTPSRIGSAGAASSRAISSAVSGVTGTKKAAPSKKETTISKAESSYQKSVSIAYGK